MLIDYKFKNFLSFKNECHLSMQASADKTLDDHLIDNGNERLCKVKIFYGANASGKTALIRSMSSMKNFIRNNSRLSSAEGVDTHGFKFVQDYQNYPTSFEISFRAKGTKYIYKFSRTNNKVLTEELKAYYTAKPTTLFRKKEDGCYYFSDNSKKLKDIEAKTSQNKLFLSVSDVWNYEKVKDVVEYLTKQIAVVGDIENIRRSLIKNVMVDFENYKKFVLKFLSLCDISISDFKVDSQKFKDTDDSEILYSLVMAMSKNDQAKAEKALDGSYYDIITMHNIKSDNDKTETYELKLMEESLGTQGLFNFAPVLYDVLKNGKVLFIDELDKSLHPKLVKQIIRMFLDEEFNPNNAQLICNTHETTLLDLDFLRRDEIMFVERDYQTGVSGIYSLADFSIRKEDDIEKAYNLGRYGAVPFIKED